MKKTLKWIMIMALVIGIAGTTAVDVRADNVSLKSSPDKRIEYTDQTTGERVLIDTSDFYTLDREITRLKSQIDSVSSLPADTFFYVTGTQGADTILRYKKINGEYFACNQNGIVSEGTAAAAVDPATLTEYSGAVAANLSVGKAGYIGRTLHLGDGSDGAASYAQGFTDGQQNVTQNLDIQYTYHVHQGDSTAGGACYSPHIHTNTCGTPIYCTNLYSYWRDVGLPTAYEVYDYHGTCTNCGAAAVTHWNPGTVNCTKCTSCGLDGMYEFSCGKTEQTIETAVITY